MQSSQPQPMFGQGMGRSFVYGAAVGFVGVFALYTAIAAHAGASFSSTVGLGLFAAFWGGLGYGGMFGAVLGAVAIDKAEHRAVHVPTGPTALEGDHRALPGVVVELGGSARTAVTSVRVAEEEVEAVAR